ncbi:MAG: dihydrolipoamide acetyltransferase family protein [Chloroflexi bacterium]|nr:dihydrolipoamide acetyltransferase family protein [Chloroflexota bacterium]
MAETISMPKLGFDMAEGTLVRWVKKVGETVNKGDVLAEIETDKATVEVESSASGVVRLLVVEEGSVVPVGSPIAIVGSAEEVIQESGNQGSGKQVKTERRESSVESPKLEILQSAIVKASPLARKIASEKKVDLSSIKGTGPGGRIVRRDIEAALAGGSPTTDHGPQTIVSTPSSVVHRPSSAVDETVSMSKLRQAIARRMAESKASIPHFYVTHEYKMDALMDLRAQFNKIVPENEKLSVNDFIIKAVALTLRQFPNLNASLNGNSVLHHRQVNVGVAVSVEGGLLTIVCRDADQKPLRQIAAEVMAMAARAREGKVKPDDIEGSSFSISNLGMYEVENFIAIINPPEAAILAVGSAREVAVSENGVVKPGWRMKATISVDHRISDGAEAAKFMQALGVFLEEPLRLVV